MLRTPAVLTRRPDRPAVDLPYGDAVPARVAYVLALAAVALAVPGCGEQGRGPPSPRVRFWHTFSAEWTPETVTFYIDGRKTHTRAYPWTFPDRTPAGPAHLLLNFAVGGAWAGRHGIEHAAFPQALQINWVRAYRKSG